MKRTILAAAAFLAFVSIALVGQAPPQPGGLPEQKNKGLGEPDGAPIPNQKWKVHDIARPHPRVVTPGKRDQDPPSDAIVLFDGKDLSKWTVQAGGGAAPSVTGTWKVEKGYMEVVPGTGSLATKDKFGDVQLHLEWATPAKVNSYGQYRGNSGIMFLRRLEIQVLDSYDNPTYADGQAGSIYGQWPPLVNPARKPGEWQAFDIVFEAPRYEGDKLVKQAYVTVFLNGVLMHNRQEFLVNMGGGGRGKAKAPNPSPAAPVTEDSIVLQTHPSAVAGSALRFRNIWARRLTGYDTESK